MIILKMTLKVIEKLREVGGNLGIDCPSDILYAIAKVENSNLKHCDKGRVVKGSSGEVGLMQIMPGSCSNKNIYDVFENIECAGEVLKDKYYFSLNKPDNYGPEECDFYYPTRCERAVRGYNGWGCDGKTEEQTLEIKNYVCNVYSNLENAPSNPRCYDFV